MSGRLCKSGALLAVALLLAATGAGAERTVRRGSADAPGRSGIVGRMEKTPVHLYFCGKDSLFLSAEERVVARPDDAAGFGRVIVEALIHGPQKDLVPTVPASAAVRAVYTTDDGTAYVDLAAAAADRHPGGVRAEMMTIYSIVNSVVLNIDAIDAVKILIDGRERPTLAGHVDLRFPFKANMLLVR